MSLRDDRGFTLVELLTTIALSLIVLSAPLLTFNSLYQNSHDNNARLDAVEVARNSLDVQARQLRNLAKRLNNTAVLDTVSSYDLIFQTSDPARTWVRYCLDTTNSPASPNQGRLWTQERSLVSTAASPVTPGMRSGCPSSAAEWTTTQVVAEHVTNRSGGQERPLFQYRCTVGTACTSSLTTYDKIVHIGALTLIDTTPESGPLEMRVTTGVHLRNQNQAPVASFVTTPASTSRTVVLNAAASTDYEGRTLSYYWFKGTLPALASINCAEAIITGAEPQRTLWGASGFIGESVTLSHTFTADDLLAGTTANIGLVVCDAGDRYGTAGITTPIAVQIPS
ncbi:MAG TPA: prepilin-type N-terminal cleavage/methylation domain-containing protein [Solirubrobacteraceae bacterium]|nr:prepilin-type N-terminal cleavage/methylation domain-containing protein [Solirubrobacteraceae bacterium]